MLEIRTILAPTDFSDHAEPAVRYACGLAERLGATCTCSTSCPRSSRPGPTRDVPGPAARTTTARPRPALDALGRVLDPSWGTPRRS